MLRSHSCALSVPLSLGFSEIRNACTESTIVGIVWEEEDRQKIIRISRTTNFHFNFTFLALFATRMFFEPGFLIHMVVILKIKRILR